MAKPKMTEKMRAGLITMAFLLVWLIFGSSVSIFSPSAGSLGVLFGSVFSLVVILGPILYVRLTNIKVKTPKPLFVEPPLWKVVPLSFAASAVIFLLYMFICSIPPLDFLADEFEKETFIGNSVLVTILFTSFFGPITIYAVYIYTHYQRIVQLNSAEWRKLKGR